MKASGIWSRTDKSNTYRCNHAIVKRMSLTILVVILATALTNCASLPVPDKGPFLVSGVPISKEPTDWYQDFCTYYQPVDDKVVPYGLSCDEETILYHASMHRVTLVNLKDPNNKTVKGSLTFALTGGRLIAYNPFNTERSHFVLQTAPADLRQDTGIDYLGVGVFYHEEKGCVKESVRYHTDHRRCTDHDFHQQQKNQCISLELLRAHYTE